MLDQNDDSELGATDDVILRGVIADVTARKDAEKQASYLMRFDSLTDLPNRRLFSETLNRAMYGSNDGLADNENSAVSNKKMALILFDIRAC